MGQQGGGCLGVDRGEAASGSTGGRLLVGRQGGGC